MKSCGAKRINFILLLAAAALALVFAGTSLSRFLFEQEDGIRGSYTNFILEHDGAGQSAILQSRGDENVAYLLVTLRNFQADGAGETAVSARDIVYSFHALNGGSEGGLQDVDESGNIVNAWGDVVMLASETSEDSKNYKVEIADDAGNVLVDGTDEYALATTLDRGDGEEPQRATNQVMLKITRTGELPAEGELREVLTVVLQTQQPYTDVRAFNVSITSSLVSASVEKSEYFGFIEERVDVRVSASFPQETLPEGEEYGAKLFLTVSGGASFDYARFRDEYPSVTAEMREDGSYMLALRPGSDAELYFYRTGSVYEITLAAQINGRTDENGEPEYYRYVSGLYDADGDGIYTVAKA